MQSDTHCDASLDISRTWEGRPLATEECTRVRLRSSPTDLWIQVDAPFYGDPPPPAPPGATDQLWNFEVVEVFLVEAASLEGGRVPRYAEIELSPHGHFLVLRLEGVRNPVTRVEVLEYEASRPDSPGRDSRWQGQARLPWNLLPKGPYRVNAFALHGLGEERQYLAHSPVPGGAPDFHRLGSFPPSDLWSPPF